MTIVRSRVPRTPRRSVGDPRVRAAVLVCVAMMVATTACTGPTEPTEPTEPTDPTPPSAGASAGQVTGEITVLAAASLRRVFTDLGAEFERRHPGATVTFSFGPSSGLATQIVNGSPADVFAAASPATMQQVLDSGRASESSIVATNSMVIAVPPANPGQVDDVTDLANPEVTVALCQEAVPCGIAADTVFTKAGIVVTPVTREQDVAAVLTKVTLGEVDAGVVYVTDVPHVIDADVTEGASGRLNQAVAVEIPDELNATTSYPVAALDDSANPATATAFATFVASPQAATSFARAGFGAP